jgi:hypothetical protein
MSLLFLLLMTLLKVNQSLHQTFNQLDSIDRLVALRHMEKDVHHQWLVKILTKMRLVSDQLDQSHVRLEEAVCDQLTKDLGRTHHEFIVCTIPSLETNPHATFYIGRSS